ncbi:SPOR domain-containing protein [Nitrosomonas sp.]|uniref:SPOR domain-containing protein n=1 Tax=Nitrosomonas sp. TaxID=42353 RepID=UPI0020841BB4|nr:SPOR domain-containing protein [Nitrosomonas sp.]GJL75890.1 MAG: hypothetical protein NMNS02_19960 [Nitrosomonas sp.]
MSRDYKSRKPTASKGGKSALMLGIFIGYTLGIVSAIGIWFYLEQAPSPFLSEEQMSEYDQLVKRSDSNKQTEGPSAASEHANMAKVEEKAQFDFYKILSNTDEPAIENEISQNAEEPANVKKPRTVEKPKPNPPSPPVLSSVQGVMQTEPVHVATETYYLQVGSFRNNADADNLKARLALLGVIASVQSADLSEKGTWYRVRVGPFTQKPRVDQVHHTLRENGIEAQFIKTR